MYTSQVDVFKAKEIFRRRIFKLFIYYSCMDQRTFLVSLNVMLYFFVKRNICRKSNNMESLKCNLFFFLNILNMHTRYSNRLILNFNNTYHLKNIPKWLFDTGYLFVIICKVLNSFKLFKLLEFIHVGVVNPIVLYADDSS